MKDKLSDDDRASLVAYRMKRAMETLEEADYNAEGGYFNTAVNRLYYSAYYAASALMLSEGIETSTHAGLKTMLSLKFVKAGKLDVSFGRLFMTLYESRQSGDYEDFVYCDSELYSNLRPETEKFIEAIARLVNA